MGEVAGALQVSIGLLRRKLHQGQVEGDLTLPETAALSLLDRSGPTTSAVLARLEQISPQSMGATLGALEDRALVERHSDPADARCAVLSLTEAGSQAVKTRRAVRNQQLATALSAEFTEAELQQLLAAAPLIERLAQNI